MASLDGSFERDGHVVAQVVEAELGVGAVGDVPGVRLLALRERHHVLDVAGAHSERVVDRLDPLGVALGQVVVDRDEVDVVAGQRVEIERHRGDEGLALTGSHLGDVALVEDDPAHHLDVEQADVHGALEGFPDRRVGLEEDLLERLAVGYTLPELDGLAGELLVGELLELGLERGDVLRLVAEALQAPTFAEAKCLLESVRCCHRPRVSA